MNKSSDERLRREERVHRQRSERRGDAAKRAETSCEEQATTQGGEATWVGTG